MPIKPKEMIRLYEEAGWKRLRQKGSHVVMGKNGERQVIPLHTKDLSKGLERELLKRLKRI